MIKALKIFSIVAFTFISISCEQHLFYLKKVKANDETSKTKNQSKINEPLKTIDFANTFTLLDSNKKITENIFASSETLTFEFLSAQKKNNSIKTETFRKFNEDLNTRKKNKKTEFQNQKNKEFPFNMFVGMMLFIIGLGIILSYFVYKDNTNIGKGFGSFLTVAFGFAFLITGLLLFINGVIHGT